MPNLFFENQGVNTYLVYQIQEADELDSMSLGMLTNNRIPGFAPALFTQMDMTKYIKYNVSAKVSAAQLFSGPVNKKRLLGVFEGIVDAMLSAEDYMLDPQTILLDLDHIFTDVSTCETVLICLPVLNPDQPQVDLENFFRNIIFRTQFDQTENCDHVAKILNYLNGASMMSLTEFKELLEQIREEGAPKPVQPRQQPVVQPVQQVQPAQPEVRQQAPVAQPAAPAPAPQPEVKPAEAPKPFSFGGLNIPGIGTTQTPEPKAEPAPAAEEEEPMSMFYLLQHYSKENAAKYKAQQEAKKAQKNQKPAAPKKPEPPKAAKPAGGMMNPGFAIPGQEPSFGAASFAVPSKPAEPVAQAPVRQVQPVAPSPAPQAAPVPAPQPQPQASVNTGTRISFGETTVLGGQIGETTVLGGAVEKPKPTPHLIRVRNNERIPLDKPVFRIGKERSYVDYFISDNSAVSRSHANIINRDGEFFVMDTNSTNHTYVNGGMIPSNVETKISHGTKIRLGNEDFEFKMY